TFPSPSHPHLHTPHPFPTRRSSDLTSRETCARPIFWASAAATVCALVRLSTKNLLRRCSSAINHAIAAGWAVMRLPIWLMAELRSEEHTSELQSLRHLVCRLLLEKK